MQAFIAVTDHDWFSHLSALASLEEINFWQPGGPIPPRQLREGAPFLLKLHKGDGGGIAGFGRFARFDALPVWLAWDVFGDRNGCPDFQSFCRAIDSRRAKAERASPIEDHVIGCIQLATPVLLPIADAVEGPRDWKDNIVRGKHYDLEEGEGARIWGDLQDRLQARDVLLGRLPLQFPSERYGEPVLVKPRLGQGIFRLAVTDAYGRACAVTGEHSLPALEASHIRPYADGGEHAIPNGLLFRSDVHRLFDKGYVAVAPERSGNETQYRFLVSRRLKDDYANGRTYYPMAGKFIQPPAIVADRPDTAALEWHLSTKFKG